MAKQLYVTQVNLDFIMERGRFEMQFDEAADKIVDARLLGPVIQLAIERPRRTQTLQTEWVPNPWKQVNITSFYIMQNDGIMDNTDRFVCHLKQDFYLYRTTL